MKQKTQLKKKMAMDPTQLQDALITLATPTDKPGHRQLLEILSNAINEYQGRDKNIILQAVYWISRKRGQSFIDAKNIIKTHEDIDKLEDTVVILKVILQLISEGKWTRTSINTDLVINMINCLDEFEHEEPGYILKNVMPLLKVGLILKMREALAIKQAELEKKATKDAELRALKVKAPEKVAEEEDVVLFKNLESSATTFANKKPYKLVFFLKLDEDRLTLTWIDHMGHAEPLPLKPEQHATLKRGMRLVEYNEKANGKLSEEACNDEKKLRTLCKTILRDFLERRVPLLINPQKMPAELESTFLVQARMNEGSIDWFDACGRKLSIDPALYPRLQQWMLHTAIHCTMQKRAASAAERLSLQALLFYVPTRQKVDEEKQAIAQKSLQEKFGLSVSLVATNDLEKLPAYKRIPGTYFLTREPVDAAGNWVLYLRKKGGINKLVNTAEWKKFNEMLVGLKDIEPAKIDVVSLHALSACISQMTVKAKPVNCLAVNDFKPEDVSKPEDTSKPEDASKPVYPPVSFIVTKRDNIWQLYFIDTLNKVLQVDLNEVPKAADILKLWEDEPDRIEQGALNALKISLRNYRPVSMITPDDYIEVRKSIEKRAQTFTGKGSCGEKEAVLQGQASSKCAKLNLDDYAIVAQAHGHISRPLSATSPGFFKPIQQHDTYPETGPGNAP